MKLNEYQLINKLKTIPEPYVWTKYKRTTLELMMGLVLKNYNLSLSVDDAVSTCHWYKNYYDGLI